MVCPNPMEACVVTEGRACCCNRYPNALPWMGVPCTLLSHTCTRLNHASWCFLQTPQAKAKVAVEASARAETSAKAGDAAGAVAAAKAASEAEVSAKASANATATATVPASGRRMLLQH
jgi:hypothetical protein